MGATPGTRLGSYRVIASIGVGGMGEVFRARDTKLDRDVALKVLPVEFALDPDRRARFQREAHVLAALNHPHIAQIHGIEDGHGQTALVMELVEGPTLAERIAKGPIALDEALEMARQIAAALSAAHDHGIVHRDLKPANIKVREDGTVKVLDFGLAKAVEPVAGTADIVNSPTLTSPSMTRQGVVLGTAAYMAPEQARGRPVDKRADIWAFGVVLFEMLTGERPFAGDDVTETIAAVVKSQPDLSRVPRPVRRLLSRCLEKDPNRRLRDILDAWDLIDSPAPADVAAGRPRSNWLIHAVFLLGGVALGAVGWAVSARREPLDPAPMRFVETLPEIRNMPRGSGLGVGTAVAVAPDGRTHVYSARENGQGRLYRRFLDQLAAEPVGDVGAAEPCFSPDGQWIAYVVGRTLRRVSVRGGVPETIATLPDAPAPVNGISWSSDGTILVGGISALWRVTHPSRVVETILSASGGTTVFYPQLLPGGRSVLYTERTYLKAPDALVVHDLRTGASKRLLQGTAGRYLPTGHLVFARQNAIYAAAFNIDQLEIRGDAALVFEGIRADNSPAAAAYHMAVADTGALVYVPGDTIVRQRTPVWINRQGQEQPVGLDPAPYSNPRVSPDGKRIAFNRRDEGSDIWIWDTERRHFKQLTNDPSSNYLAAWFPDSKRVAFSVSAQRVTRIYEQAADGSGPARPITDKAFPSQISRDGTVMLLAEPVGVQWDVGALPLSNPNARRTLLGTAAVERNPVLSPDGRWLAYESDETGRFEIYVRPFPNVEDTVLKVTSDGGIAPVWARDGRELFYWKERGQLASIMAIPILPGKNFDFDPARQLFEGTFGRPSWDTNYDVGVDGRFLLLKTTGPPQRDEIVTVVNWAEELKRLVPIK